MLNQKGGTHLKIIAAMAVELSHATMGREQHAPPSFTTNQRHHGMALVLITGHATASACHAGAAYTGSTSTRPEGHTINLVGVQA